MPAVFISYRRDDSQGWAARLADDLSDALGPDLVFSDIEIPIGSDFGAVLRRAIAASEVLLVVIGRRWADPDADGRRRLFEPDDWVRIEIETALALGKRLVPVPVAGAALPAATDLPDSLQPMLRLQAAPLSERHWQADVAALAARLRAWLAPTGRIAAAAPAARPPPPVPAGTRWPWRLARALARRLRRVAGAVLVLALVYAGLRLFGDASVQRWMDAAERHALGQLAQAWQRVTSR